MPYAVLRVAKIKTQAHALSATGHNYRQAQHPHAIANADQEAPHPNREYVNHAQQDYWSLLEARIQEAGVKRIRSDSVRGMELILTGSPEGFIRGQDGRAVDYSKSKWAGDNLRFLQEKFGAKNIVSFTLHQDEKTPHIHAVLVPITEKNTLSADQLFNPRACGSCKPSTPRQWVRTDLSGEWSTARPSTTRCSACMGWRPSTRSAWRN